jgi:hypothetical protein
MGGMYSVKLSAGSDDSRPWAIVAVEPMEMWQSQWNAMQTQADRLLPTCMSRIINVARDCRRIYVLASIGNILASIRKPFRAVCRLLLNINNYCTFLHVAFQCTAWPLWSSGCSGCSGCFSWCLRRLASLAPLRGHVLTVPVAPSGLTESAPQIGVRLNHSDKSFPCGEANS